MKNLVFAFLMLSLISVAFAQDGEFHLDKTYQMSKTGIIDLSCSDAKVFITGSTRMDAHIKIDRTVTAQGWSSGPGEFSVEVTTEDGSIKIWERQEGSGITFGSYNEEYRIQIEAPEGAGIRVRGDDGDYFIKNVNGRIELSLDDADAELTGCKGDKFSFRLDDGDLRMDRGQGVLDIEADDADIEIYKGEFTTINADLDDGDLIIETSIVDNGSYNLHTEDGLISMKIAKGGGDFNVWHDDGSVITQGDFKTTYKSEDETRLTLGNGSARVRIRADDARVKLSAN